MTIISQVLVLFVLILAGFVFAKLKILNKDASGYFSAFIIKISLPCLIITSFQRPFSRELLREGGIALACSLAVYAFSFLLAYFYPRLLNIKGKERGVHRYALIISNCGFMGYPIVEAVLGETWVFHAVIFNIPFNFLAYSICAWIISKEGEEKIYLTWKNFFNACVAATFIGLALFVFSVRLPEFLHRSIKMTGDITSPLSMIVVGISMAHANPGQIFGKWRIYVTVASRLFLIPALMTTVLYFFGIRGNLLLLSALITAMPVGSTTSILASHYRIASEEAGSLVFLSTLLSMLTVPLVISIVNSLVN